MNTQDTYFFARHEIETMDVIDDKVNIAKTEGILEEINYSPPFLLDVPGFTALTRKAALKSLSKINDTPEAQIKSLPLASSHSPEEIKRTTIEVFLKEYKLLQKLRADDPEAWDHINELYEDD